MDINFESIAEYVKEHPNEGNVKIDEKDNLTLENNLICFDNNGNVISITPKMG